MIESTKLYFLLIMTCLYFQNCNTKPKAENNFSSYPANNDSLTYSKDFINSRDKIFNLNSLYKGTQDSLEIRVWPRLRFSSDMKGVFIFKIYDTSYYGWVYYANNYTLIKPDGSTDTFIKMQHPLIIIVLNARKLFLSVGGKNFMIP